MRAVAPPCRNGPPLQNGAVRICPIGKLKIRVLETERGLCYHSVLCNASVPPLSPDDLPSFALPLHAPSR